MTAPRDADVGGGSSVRHREVSGGGSARLTADVALLAVSLAAGLGAARLTQSPAAAGVVGPIVAVVVTGHLATTVTRRLRAPLAAVLGAGAVTVALVTVWGQLLSATRFGVPTATTWRVFVDRLDAAGSVIRSSPTPVPATPGVVLCVALGAGLTAVLGGTLWAWQEARPSQGAHRSPRPLVALVPSFGLFCYTALLSSQVDRIQGALAYLVCALGFVIAADRPALAGGRRFPSAGVAARAHDGGRGPRPTRLVTRLGVVGPALVAGGLAVAAVVAVDPGLSSMRVNALPFSHQGGRGFGLNGAGGGAGGGDSGFGPAGPFTGPSDLPGVRAVDLYDDMQAVLTNRTTELMFSATSPVPTYWQLAVLTRFNGRAWVPDPTTQAAINALAVPTPERAVPGLPVLPEPKPATTFQSTITIAALQATLLPLPPRAVSVEGINATLVSGFGALHPFEASPFFTYWANAALPPGQRSSRPASRPVPMGAAASAVAATPAASLDRSSLAPYLQLPPMSSQVVQLAHQIVAGANGPAAKATALARWFDSGRFRYTLAPPDPGSANPVQSFLFTTRQGFCQQFAAAYTVLARLDGLPSRVAVGFTTGSLSRGRYRVTGADAHVWPEVYLGPSTGWTSFEPTPASSGEPNGVGVVTGTRSGTQGSGGQGSNVQSTVALPAHRQLFSHPPTPTTTPLVIHGQTTTPAPSRTVGSSGVVQTLVALALVVGVVGVGALAWAVRRRLRLPPRRLRRLRRRRRRRSHDPTADVLAQWRDAQTVLERARLGRRPAETLHEHATRLESLAQGRWLAYAPAVLTIRAAQIEAPGTVPDERDPIAAAVDAYRKLAELATRASYASDPCTTSDAADAEELSMAVRAGLTRPARRDRVPVRV